MSSSEAATEPTQPQVPADATSGGDVDTTTAPEQTTPENPVAPATAETEEPATTPDADSAPDTTEPEEPVEIEPFKIDSPANMPEGFKVDPVVADTFAEAARAEGLSKDSAQKIADKLWPQMWEQEVARQTATHQAWLEASQLDPEIGGDNYENNMRIKGHALDAFGDDELRELLNGPFGDHPAINRALVKVGRTVSEDSFVGGDATDDPDSEAAIAKVMYPNTPATL